MKITSNITMFKLLGLKNIIIYFFKNMASINHYYILQRGLENLHEAEISRGKFILCNASHEDITAIVNSVNYLDHLPKKEIVVRLLFYRSGFKNCYIAKTTRGDIAYIQWLIYPDENSIIKKYYSNRFYMLREKQVMTENAFTYPKHRGFGLMRVMTNELLNIAKQKGYTSAITYVRKDRIDVINDRIRNGFKITKLVTELKILGYTKRLL